MNQDQSAIVDVVRSILGDQSTQASVIAAEGPGWNESLWKVLCEKGFATISIPEALGGSDGDLADACLVLHELGRAAAAVPWSG